MYSNKAGRALIGIGLMLFVHVAGALAAEPTLELSLRDCIDMALTENLSLKAFSMGLNTDDLSIVQAQSKFDLSLNFDLNRNHSSQKNYFEYYGVDNIERENTTMNFSLGQELSTGADWGVGFYNSLSESNIETVKNYTSYLGVELSQPLLKGFGKKVATANVYYSRLERDTTVHDIENMTVELLYQVQNSYWNLVYAWQSMGVLELSVQQADSLLAYNLKGRELGVLTDSDVLEAESMLLSRQQDILNQQNIIRETEDSLRRLLNMDSESEMKSVIKPTDTATVGNITIDIGKAFEEAVALRPDYKLNKKYLERYQFSRDLSQNGLLPNLDLTARYNIHGSGTTYDKDIRDMGGFGQNDVSLGIMLRLPLGNRSAKAELKKNEIEIKRQELTIRDLESRILTEIRSAARNVKIRQESVDVARKNVEVDELKLKIEEEKFKNQLSTSYYVLQFQKDLAIARNLYNKTLIDYTIAVNELNRASGSMLKKLNISIVAMD